jgi:hypothetical protein
MTHRPTQLDTKDIYWEVPFWQIINANAMVSQAFNKMNSIIVHRCDSAAIRSSYKHFEGAPRTYWGHLQNMNIPCWYCDATVPPIIQTLWTLHNADKHDNTQNHA